MTSFTASAGDYKSTFLNGVVTELAATHYSGLLQYKFPTSSEGHMLVGVSHYLPSLAKICASTASNALVKSYTLPFQNSLLSPFLSSSASKSATARISTLLLAVISRLGSSPGA